MTAEREILDPPKGKDGLFVQPEESGPDREVTERHNRERFAHHFNYADPNCGDPHTYDPQGN